MLHAAVRSLCDMVHEGKPAVRAALLRHDGVAAIASYSHHAHAAKALRGLVDHRHAAERVRAHLSTVIANLAPASEVALRHCVAVLVKFIRDTVALVQNDRALYRAAVRALLDRYWVSQADVLLHAVFMSRMDVHVAECPCE